MTKATITVEFGACAASLGRPLYSVTLEGVPELRGGRFWSTALSRGAARLESRRLSRLHGGCKVVWKC